MKHLHLKIHGRVQGVFFREEARQKSQELGLSGYVKNLPDGTVEVVAEGEEEVLKNMLEWCKIGPRHAKVEKVEESWNDVGESEFETFKIVY